MVEICSLFEIFLDIFRLQSSFCIGFMATGAPTLQYFCHVIMMVGCRSWCSYVGSFSCLFGLYL